MFSDDASISSSYSNLKDSFAESSTGSQKIKYEPSSDWDFHLDVSQADRAIDLALVLPHCRARHQPPEHRLNMFVGAESSPVKLKACRSQAQTKFCLEVQANTSDVTIWVPSDFAGQIQHSSSRATYSPAFMSQVAPNVQVNAARRYRDVVEDYIVVRSRGSIVFRVFDTVTGTAERPQRDLLKRLIGRGKKSTSAMDWDFLVQDQR